MALTLGQLRQQVLLQIGGAPSTAPASAVVTETTPYSSADERVAEIINEAGVYFFSEPWGFRQRDEVTVALVIDQDYVDLPADVGELQSIRCNTSVNSAIRVVSPDAIAQWRQSSLTIKGNWPYAIAIVRADATAGNAMPARRVQLFPTPSVAGNLLLWYRAKWIPVTAAMASSWQIHVPDYAEAPLRALVRAVAAGDEEGDTEARVMRVKDGPFWRAAWVADTEAHPIGGAQIASGEPFDPYASITVLDPS